MEETIRKFKNAHDNIMCITLQAQDAMAFASGINLMREAISELETIAAKGERNEQ